MRVGNGMGVDQSAGPPGHVKTAKHGAGETEKEGPGPGAQPDDPQELGAEHHSHAAPPC